MASDRVGEKLAHVEAENRDLRARLLELETAHERAALEREDLSRAQHELLETLEHYSELYHFAPIAYLSLEPSGVLRELNLTAARLLGAERGRLIGRPLWAFVAADDKAAFLEHVRRCRAGEELVQTELQLASATGGIRVELLSRPVRTAARSEFRTVVLDLSARLALEEERRWRESEALCVRMREEGARVANEAKDRFIAMLSHELRTPLTPIVAALHLMECHASLPTGLDKQVALIRRNVEAQVRMVDDLLDATRVVRGKLGLTREDMDLRSLVAEVMDEAGAEAHQKRLTVELQLEATGTIVDGDPYRLKQVVRNLVNNAIKFTPPGGSIVARVDNPGPGRVRFEVVDSGIGLTREQLARAFLPFEQMDDGHTRQGLGLGLAISKGIIEAHGGAIQGYSSGAGRGARFAFELESVVRRLAPEPAARSFANAPGAKRVLLVEDHLDSAEALCTLLEMHGYQVHVANSIAAAMASPVDECDVLVSDIQLPDGTGRALLERLPRALPAIAVSGYGTVEDVRRSRAVGFVDHLVKPVSAERLLEAIERALSA